MKALTTPYIGRFAPSPSGPLHFGSLVTALASYLDAKHYHGQWLVRMEDIDPPREVAGAQKVILASLEAHGLLWDAPILRQSSRLDAYEIMLKQFNNEVYRCQCSRQRMLELRGIYDGHCLHNPPSHTSKAITSTRVSLKALPQHRLQAIENYTDIFQGLQHQSLLRDVGDFILRRKDGLFAYQLAVICDDIYQGITHIIRGSDLLSSTQRQRYLIALFNHVTNTSYQLPEYGHIPVASNKLGQKLSKQNKAPPIDNAKAFSNLCSALRFLRHPPPPEIINGKNITLLLQWATEHWQRKNIPQTLSFVVET